MQTIEILKQMTTDEYEAAISGMKKTIEELQKDGFNSSADVINDIREHYIRTWDILKNS